MEEEDVERNKYVMESMGLVGTIKYYIIHL